MEDRYIKMKMNLDEFFSKIKNSDYSKIINKTININVPDEYDIIVLDEGVIQVQNENVLEKTFITDDGLFWAAYKIKDFSFKHNLMTKNELWEYQKKSALYDQANYPEKILKKLFPDENYFKIEFRGQKCTRRLRHNEYQRIKGEMGKDKFLKLIDLIEEREKKTPWFDSSPTVETPYELYIYDVNDNTYVKFFSSKKDMFSYFNKISRKPLSSDFFKNIMVMI